MQTRHQTMRTKAFIAGALLMAGACRSEAISVSVVEDSSIRVRFSVAFDPNEGVASINVPIATGYIKADFDGNTSATIQTSLILNGITALDDFSVTYSALQQWVPVSFTKNIGDIQPFGFHGSPEGLIWIHYGQDIDRPLPLPDGGATAAMLSLGILALAGLSHLIRPFPRSLGFPVA